MTAHSDVETLIDYPANWSEQIGEPDSDHAAGNGASATPDRDQLVFRRLADVAAEVDARPPRTYLFEAVWPAGDHGVVAAPDKAGKTWAMVDAAVSAAAGLPWLDIYACRAPGPAVMFAGEGGDAKWLRRIRAVAAHKGLTRDQTDALPIVVCFRAPALGSAGHRGQIREQLAESGPALTIIDPLYLAAGGANGADLYAMGAMLGAVQRLTQAAGSSLMLAHHWNKTGTGTGHNRSSGVGPGAWGRVLASVAVAETVTDPATKETTVEQTWSFRGDEIPDTEATFLRRVRADDPTDLSSPMHYSLVQVEAADPVAGPGGRLKPSAVAVHRVLMRRSPLSVRQIGDQLAEDQAVTGRKPLRARTIQAALSELMNASMIEHLGDIAGAPIYAPTDHEEAENAR
jgi:hypothetical protein